jgi:hypothetical protein
MSLAVMVAVCRFFNSATRGPFAWRNPRHSKSFSWTRLQPLKGCCSKSLMLKTKHDALRVQRESLVLLYIRDELERHCLFSLSCALFACIAGSLLWWLTMQRSDVLLNSVSRADSPPDTFVCAAMLQLKNDQRAGWRLSRADAQLELTSSNDNVDDGDADSAGDSGYDHCD